MNSAIAYDTPAAPPDPALSPADDIAELKRKVEALEADKEEIKKRAAERYKDMLHATRHAERTEQALQREKEDKMDKEMTTLKCFSGLKQRIADLEFQISQEQRSEHTFTLLQDLQTANNRLQAKLAQEKEAGARVQSTLKNMSSKFQEDKNQIKLEARQSYEKALAERQKRWKEEYARQLAATTQKRSQEHESIQQENERLKRQLQESQQALDWHKAQFKQQSAQRGGIQGSPMTAGIHAGFPLATQQSPSRVTDQARKRRRLNPTGYVSTAVSKDVQSDENSDAGLPTPEQQRGYANPAATSTRSRHPANGQLSQNPATPTRLPQGLNTNMSPQQAAPQVQAQAYHQAQAQAPAQTWTQAKAQEQAQAKAKVIIEHAQRTGTVQLFHAFMLRANASRQKTGQPQLGIEQLWHVFSQNTAQQASRKPSTSRSGQDGSQVTASGNFAMMQNLQQGGGQIALQSPFRPSAMLVAQHAHQPISDQPPSFSQANGFGSAGRMPTPQPYQQPPPFASQNSMESLSNMSFSPMLTLTAECNANSPAMPSTDASFGQATLQEVQTTGDNLDLSAQFPAHSQDGSLYPSPPEDLQGTQHVTEFTNFGDISGWASPTLDPPARPTVSRKRPMAAPPPSTRSSTPAPRGQDFPVCVHCHDKWWNGTCDAGEPCQNCVHSGKSCERPKCHLDSGGCTSNRCSRVHEGDTRFRYVVSRPKTLKREGKKGDAAVSPVEVSRMQ